MHKPAKISLSLPEYSFVIQVKLFTIFDILISDLLNGQSQKPIYDRTNTIIYLQDDKKYLVGRILVLGALGKCERRVWCKYNVFERSLAIIRLPDET